MIVRRSNKMPVSSEWVDACQRRMTRAGRLLEAANNAENAARRVKDAALAEFADARRQLETAQASNDGDMPQISAQQNSTGEA